MSTEGRVEVVRVGAAAPHPNADTLELLTVLGYPVIVKRGEYREGDLAVYVPVDSVVPGIDPRWQFLDGKTRIKAKRLRGVFSQGLLTKADPGMEEGQDVGERLGITRYEPPAERMASMGGECEPGPQGVLFPCYTDIEGLRRHANVLVPGEKVVITEKIHGANARYMYHEGRLWVGSRTQVKKRDDGNMWWKVADEMGLEETLSRFPGLIFFGEVFGQVQDLKYGIKTGATFRCFDIFDTAAGRYVDWGTFCKVIEETYGKVPTVPVLYVGEWKPEMAESWCEGNSTLADHVREGFVVKPVKERYDVSVGRVILKRHGQGYLLRKE